MNTGRLTINRVNSGRFAQSYLKVSSAESRAGWNGPKNIFPCLTISDFNNFPFEWHFKNFSFYFDFEKICPQADSKRYDLQKCQKSARFLQGRKILVGIAVWHPLRPPPPCFEGVRAFWPLIFRPKRLFDLKFRGFCLCDPWFGRPPPCFEGVRAFWPLIFYLLRGPQPLKCTF